MASPRQAPSIPGPLGCTTSTGPRDSARAIVETAFEGLDRQMSNEFLIAEAGHICRQLLTGSMTGPLERSAAAHRFLGMRDILQSRLDRAPRDERFLPRLEGISWRRDDPLAGIVEGISPFHMADWVSSFVKSDEPCGGRRRAQASRPRTQVAAPGSSAGRSTPPDPWARSKRPSWGGIGGGLQEPRGDGAVGAGVDLGLETLLNLLEAELLGVIKAAFDSLMQWINALREGVGISTRRFAIKFLPHVIANTAAGIKGAPKVITRRIEGGTIAVKGQEIDWTGMAVPAPSLRADMRKAIWNQDAWHHPSDGIALDAAEKMAVEMAQAFLGRLDCRQNGARLYLWLLRKKHKADYYEMVRDVALEIRKRQ